MAVVVVVRMVVRMRIVMISIDIYIAAKIFKRLSAEQARDQRAQQWQEENCLNHVGLSLSSS